MSTAARYRITHETRYCYSVPVALSQQLLHLNPRECSWQQCHAASLATVPAATTQQQGTDCFGNPLARLSFETLHSELKITAELDVSVEARCLPDIAASPPWETVCEQLDYSAGITPSPALLDASRFRYESPAVRLKKVFVAYGDDCFSAGTPLLVGTGKLMEKIFREFTFDSSATEVTTPLLEVLENKRGVCQDFAHLMIACLRSRGLAARYVSGYLLTEPPPGQPRLLGADASHAWVSVWCPVNGWVDFDPTNNIVPGTAHITLGWGRDFTDISPLRGVILGGGSHELEVRVTVMPTP